MDNASSCEPAESAAVRFLVPPSHAVSDGKTILDADAIQRGLTRVAHEIAERNTDIDRVGLIGIQRGGIHLARRLARLLGDIWGQQVPCGVIDVSMHRDDIAHRGVVTVQPTEVPFDVEGRIIVCLLYTSPSPRDRG